MTGSLQLPGNTTRPPKTPRHSKIGTNGMSHTTVSSLEDIFILLVEDNEIDVMAFQRGLKKHDIANPLTLAENGREALQILRGQHSEKNVGRQVIVFLDLNMPIMTGVEFLDELRRDPELSSTVVFVLTTSDHEVDLAAAYKKNVAGYILKSRVGDACSNLHDLMRSYWRIVVLPEAPEAPEAPGASPGVD